jgi:enolase
MATVEFLDALEILDSRGRPTLQVTCQLREGGRATAQVPSGASTGRAEAVELRDGDAARHRGLGCRRAAAQVTGPILSLLKGRSFADQAALDRTLRQLDGTPDKSRLGANAVLGVSIAFARAVAAQAGMPLYEQFAGMTGSPCRSLPRLTVNLFSGGKHAGGQVPVQDVLLVPAADSIDAGLAAVCAVYQAAAERIRDEYGMRLLTADEGGLAPPFPSVDAMIATAVDCIRSAGWEPGVQMHLALDVAASHFFDAGVYCFEDERLDSAAMIACIAQWVETYPIVSVEDGLAEDDWEHWPALRERLAGRALTVGDDLLCTNPGRIQRAINERACDALLLKVNQIGTVTEAAEALRLARAANWQVTASARSGETEDHWLADLAVGWGADQIKVGSVTQSERLAKYNRLLAIEKETRLTTVNWP